MILQLDFTAPGNTIIMPKEFLHLNDKIKKELKLVISVPKYRSYDILPPYIFPLFSNYKTK